MSNSELLVCDVACPHTSRDISKSSLTLPHAVELFQTRLDLNLSDDFKFLFKAVAYSSILRKVG